MLKAGSLPGLTVTRMVVFNFHASRQQVNQAKWNVVKIIELPGWHRAS